MNSNKKVICVKDIPSNLIEEAIFILKTDMDEPKSQKVRYTKNQLVLKETEDFISTYSFDLEKQRITEKNIVKKRKTQIVLGAIAFVLVCFLVSVIIHF